MLLSLDPEGFHKMRPDLDMLREVYKRNQYHVRGQVVRESFESVLENWSDEQVREFLTRWLFEPGQLLEVETAPHNRLRDFLGEVYKLIFG